MPLRQPLESSDLRFGSKLQPVLNAVVACLCGPDAEVKVTFCNDALLSTTGYRAEEMIGKNLHELLHPSRSDGTANRAAECGFSRAIGAHQATHVVGEFYWRKDGTRFPAECWAHPLLQPIGPTEFVLTFQDLTESHQDKEALRLSQDKFRRILANAPDVEWTSDRNGWVV